MYTGIHGPTHPDPQRRSHTLPSIMGRRLGREGGRQKLGERDKQRERHGGGGGCRFAASFLINLDNILSYESFNFPNIALFSSCSIKRSRQRLLTIF